VCVCMCACVCVCVCAQASIHVSECTYVRVHGCDVSTYAFADDKRFTCLPKKGYQETVPQSW